VSYSLKDKRYSDLAPNPKEARRTRDRIALRAVLVKMQDVIANMADTRARLAAKEREQAEQERRKGRA
jgi:hypothetical protein